MCTRMLMCLCTHILQRTRLASRITPWPVFYCTFPLFLHLSLLVSPSRSLCLLSVIYQTDLSAQKCVGPPLHLTPLTNRLPSSESGLWPCHSLARLIGFHLSLQRKGGDYKQINREGLHGGWPARAARIPGDRRGDWECVKVVGLKTRSFKARLFTAVVRQGWWR